MTTEYIAEVIESSTTEFTAQTRELHGAPPFGDFIKVGSPVAVIGMIYDISTGSSDANRRPIAYGKTEEELRNEQPQIFELLRTEIKAKIVGYCDQYGMRQQLFPISPEDFRTTCTRVEWKCDIIWVSDGDPSEWLINRVQDIPLPS